MKNKTIIKIIGICVLLVILLSAVTTVLGVSMEIGDFRGRRTGVGNGLSDTANTIIGVVQIIGVAVAVVMLIVLGMKFMTGAPEGKATVKAGMLYYLLGAVLLLGTTGILQIVKTYSTETFPEEAVHYTPGTR